MKDHAQRQRYRDSPPPILKVLIVDDEPTVHDVTALALVNFQYHGYKLQLISAYSAIEAREILTFDGPFALILLDVAMETADADLGLVHFVREELKDPIVRIILRTGQPRMVLQRQVMCKYEIDYYSNSRFRNEKAELTNKCFDAAVTTSIRIFLELKRLDQVFRGLVRILEYAKVLEAGNLDEGLPETVLIQIEEVMSRTNEDGLNSLLINRKDGKDSILCRRGSYGNSSGELNTLVDQDGLEAVDKALVTGTTICEHQRIVVPLFTDSGEQYVSYFEDRWDFGDIEHYLVKIYSSQLKSSLDNKMLTRELVRTQQEIVTTLVGVIETRLPETGLHVQRVGQIARLLARESAISNQTCELLFLAAPLHDIGKVGISDAILKKSGKLTTDEYEEMKTHTIIGYNILKSKRRPALQLGARICLEHHEWWNGQGYPNRIAGDEISFEARICSIADVLDALCSNRIYKDGVSLNDALSIIAEGRGTQFDPVLVDLLLANRDKVHGIYASFE